MEKDMIFCQSGQISPNLVTLHMYQRALQLGFFKISLFQDLGEFGTRDYSIESGNVGDVFDVSFDIANPRLDLVVKGDLDREKLEAYTLVIVAKDGGTPPRTGSLTLKVNVQVNKFFWPRDQYHKTIFAIIELPKMWVRF